MYDPVYINHRWKCSEQSAHQIKCPLVFLEQFKRILPSAEPRGSWYSNAMRVKFTFIYKLNSFNNLPCFVIITCTYTESHWASEIDHHWAVPASATKPQSVKPMLHLSSPTSLLASQTLKSISFHSHRPISRNRAHACNVRETDSMPIPCPWRSKPKHTLPTATEKVANKLLRSYARRAKRRNRGHGKPNRHLRFQRHGRNAHTKMHLQPDSLV